MTLTCAEGTARGASVYRYAFDQTHYVAPLGGTINVSVYLQETDGTVFVNNGLINAGVKIRFDDPPQPITPAKVLTTSHIANISGLDWVWSKSAEPDLGYADLSLGSLDNTVYGEEVSAGTYRIPLGRFTFTAGTTPNEATHLRATDFNTAMADIIYYDNELNPIALDGWMFDGMATITTAPEPGTLLLLAIAGLSLIGYVRRCHQRIEAINTP